MNNQKQFSGHNVIHLRYVLRIGPNHVPASFWARTAELDTCKEKIKRLDRLTVVVARSLGRFDGYNQCSIWFSGYKILTPLWLVPVRRSSLVIVFWTERAPLSCLVCNSCLLSSEIPWDHIAGGLCV